MNEQKKPVVSTYKNKIQTVIRTNFIFFFAGIVVITAIVWSTLTFAVAKSTDVVNHALPEVTVYKSASCSCCRDWAKYLKEAGFKVTSYDREDMDSIRISFGVKPGLSSCHTALVDGYVIEGHVPAMDIIQLLKNKPDAVGLVAPGMPKYSPGMQASNKQPRGYDVLLFDKEGSSQVFTRY